MPRVRCIYYSMEPLRFFFNAMQRRVYHVVVSVSTRTWCFQVNFNVGVYWGASRHENAPPPLEEKAVNTCGFREPRSWNYYSICSPTLFAPPSHMHTHTQLLTMSRCLSCPRTDYSGMLLTAVHSWAHRCCGHPWRDSYIEVPDFRHKCEHHLVQNWWDSNQPQWWWKI